LGKTRIQRGREKGLFNYHLTSLRKHEGDCLHQSTTTQLTKISFTSPK
jgi:hypothetical protein